MCPVFYTNGYAGLQAWLLSVLIQLFFQLLLVLELCRLGWEVELLPWDDFRDALIARSGVHFDNLLKYKLILGANGNKKDDSMQVDSVA